MLVLVGFAIGVIGAQGADPSAAETTEPRGCDTAESGVLEVSDLPEGSNAVDCRAVGRLLDLGDATLIVPSPGGGVGTVVLLTDGEEARATIYTSPDGEIEYASSQLDGDGAQQVVEPGVAVDGDPADPDPKVIDPEDGQTKRASCVGHGKRLGIDAEHTVQDGGGPDIHPGDGNGPAGLRAAQLNGVFSISDTAWVSEISPCTSDDLSSAPPIQTGSTTTYEADINSSANCTTPDGVSTMDSGDLPSDSVGATCWWISATFKVREFDIRFNTDKSFTTNPTLRGCVNKYDVRSLMTHELGHVYGIKDSPADYDFKYRTMYKSGFTCDNALRTTKRDLGKIDVIALREICP